MITVNDIIAVAREQVGYVEPKNGRTKFGIWYADQVHNTEFEAAAWCDMSIVWCAYEAGRRRGGVNGGHDALDQVGKFAYTPAHAYWFAHQGRFNNTPSEGALAFFDWGASRSLDAIDHVGLVIGTTGAGEVITLEGNTLEAGKPSYEKRYRGYHNIVGFGHPVYDTGHTPLPPPTPDPVTKGKFPLPPGHWFGIESIEEHNHSGAVAADKPKVRQLQELLNGHGFHLVVDGEFGPRTKAAVMDFQAQHKLKADGLVGPVTWAAL